MKAIARLLLGCGVIITSTSVQAGTSATMQVIVASDVIGQNAQATDAERKQSAEQWLKLARQSLKAGDVDQATKYVERAEKLNVKFDSMLSRMSDTPEKVRRDIVAAKNAGTQPATPSQRFTAARPDQAPATPASANLPTAPPRGEITANFANDAKTKAVRFLESGRAALKQGNINEAISWRQRAAAVNATFAPGEYSPAELGRELQQAGVDPSRLEIRPPSPLTETPNSAAPLRPARLPPIGSARPIAGGNAAQAAAVPQQAANQSQADAKSTAVRLAAQAQAALDRGDLQLAKQLADQAEALQVPDSAFADGELRPWEVGLRVQSAIVRRSGIQRASNNESVPAVASENGPAGRFPVSRGVYDPSNDRSRNVLVQDLQPTPAPPVADSDTEQQNDSAGVQLFRQGMAALAAQDRAAALQSFREAWKYERELPAEIRNELQDKLSLLGRAEPAATPMGQVPSQLEDVASAQHLQYQKLYREISAEEQAAKKMTSSDPKGALEKMQALRGRVNEADLDAPAKKQLLTFVDRSITQLTAYIEQNRFEIELNDKNKRILDEINREGTEKFQTDDKIAELIEQYNKLVEEERFKEAEVIAKQVRELAPENPISQTLMLKSKMQNRHFEQAMLRDAKEQNIYDALTSVEEAASSSFDDRQIVKFATGWKEFSQHRLERQREGSRRLSPVEIEIQKSLSKQVDVRFTDRPLSEVMDTLGSLAGINIHLDPAGLAAEGLTPSTPVTLNFAQPISLRSVLMLILEPLRLGFDIRNEVLIITSEQAKVSRVYPKTYYVADLVVPIPNFVPGYDMGLPAAIRQAHQALGYGNSMQPVSTAPLAMSQDPLNPQVGATPSVLAQYAANSRDHNGTRPTNLSGMAPGSMGGAALADFDTLIELIQQTIAPDTWADAGGSGAIESFPTNLSLVVSQTQDVHDQLADLLEQLRRLQDLQVAIEVRFIRLSDNFFERIGIDFDMTIDDNVQQLRRDDEGPSQAIGLTSGGQPTGNRDIPILTGTGPGAGSFALTNPTFGGFNAGAGALNFGVAILSDIETFFLLQAATGDDRTNVMQAPKVTLFNGQAASVADSSQRPFVTSLIPVVGDFAAAHQPVITVLNEGTQLGVQAVVSSDRRFVRLTLVPFFSQIGDVEEFTFTGSTTTDTGTNVVDNNGEVTGDKDNTTSVRTGTTVQLPTFSFTTVSTTVSVPDGGTVLLGGIKRLSEQRNEQGVPMLNKLPYVNRLFKNVGLGRSTQSLMLMVTPRIVIQEEEEEKLGIEVTP